MVSKRSFFCLADWRVVCSVIHRVRGDKKLLRRNLQTREITLDMFAVGYDGVSMPIDPKRQREHEAMKSGIEAHPDPGPEYKRLTAQLGDQVRHRQSETPIDALDVPIVIFSPQSGY